MGTALGCGTSEADKKGADIVGAPPVTSPEENQELLLIGDEPI